VGGRSRAGGDKVFERVCFQRVFYAVMTGDPLSRAFYDRKWRTE